MHKPCTTTVAAAMLAALAAASTAAAQPPQSGRLQPLRVEGTRVIAGKNTPIVLRGVNAACLEWTSDGEGHILETVRVAVQDWKSNVVRLPLSQDRWFGKAPEQKDAGKAYRALVKQVVDRCASLGAYVMLDLHWSNAGVWGRQIGQHVMPDNLSVEFWKDCANAYRNHPAVLFDLYNEPHDVTWDVWLNGGTVTENDRQRGYTNTFEAVGMQALLDAVRGTGARNVVVAGGLDWAYDMSGFLDGKRLNDPRGNGVIYANHNYPFKGDTFDQWLEKMKRASQAVPITVSEFGDGGGRRRGGAPGQWVRQVLQALQDNGWHWQAWDMHPAAGPTLISDWNYTPTPYFGVYVKQALAGTLEPYVPGPAPETAAIPTADPALPQAAPAVLDRAIAAMGGAEALGRIGAATWRQATGISFGGTKSAYTGTVTIQGLDHQRLTLEGEGPGGKVSTVVVLAGDRGARSWNGARTEFGATELAAQRSAALQTAAAILLVPLRGPGFALASVRDATVDGKPAAGVLVTPAGGKPFALYFSKETGLPVRLLAEAVGFGGDTYVQETLYGSYADHAGIKKAMRVVVKRDGEVLMEHDLSDFRVLPSVDPAAFTIPQ